MKTVSHFTLFTITAAMLSGCGMMHDNRTRTMVEPPNPGYTKPHDQAYNEERMRCSPGRHRDAKC